MAHSPPSLLESQLQGITTEFLPGFCHLNHFLPEPDHPVSHKQVCSQLSGPKIGQEGDKFLEITICLREMLETAFHLLRKSIVVQALGLIFWGLLRLSRCRGAPDQPCAAQAPPPGRAWHPRWSKRQVCFMMRQSTILFVLSLSIHKPLFSVAS